MLKSFHLVHFLQQVKEEESNEKSQLAQSCRIFHGWPTMALRKVSDSFTWSNKPAGEGELRGLQRSACFTPS